MNLNMLGILNNYSWGLSITTIEYANSSDTFKHYTGIFSCISDFRECRCFVLEG